MLSDSTCGKIVGQIVGQKLRIKNKLTYLSLKKMTQYDFVLDYYLKIIIFQAGY